MSLIDRGRAPAAQPEPFVACCLCGANASYCFWRHWLCVVCGEHCPTSVPEAETVAWVAKQRAMRKPKLVTS